MKKKYEKPEVEIVSLVTEETMTGEDFEDLEGEMGVESSIFD